MADSPQQDRDLKMPREERNGRFYTKYDPTMALEIVERIAEGETLKSICSRDGGYVHRTTFNRWVVEHPELKQAYEAARKLAAYAHEDEAIELSRTLMKEPGTAQRVRAFDLAMGQLRWSASKKNPEQFGEKGNLNLTVPIQINTSLDLGQGGSNNTAEFPDIYALAPKQNALPAPSAEVTQPEPVKSLVEVAKEARREAWREKVSGPQKRVLTPRIGMDEETPLKPREPDGRVRNG